MATPIWLSKSCRTEIVTNALLWSVPMLAAVLLLRRETPADRFAYAMFAAAGVQFIWGFIRWARRR